MLRKEKRKDTVERFGGDGGSKGKGRDGERGICDGEKW